MIITVLDSSLREKYVLDQFKSLLWIDKYIGFGEFELQVPLNSSNYVNLSDDMILSIPQSDQLMIIEQREIKTDVENGNILIIKGRSMQSILNRRIIWGQLYLTGDFQSGIETLLNDNFINPTDPDRKVENFIFESSSDPKITVLEVSEQFFGDDILNVIESLCTEEGIGFKITRNNSRQLVFKLYVGTDRSFNQDEVSHVIFSPSFDNLMSSDYIESSVPYKTITLVYGEGEGSNQTIREVSLPDGAGTGLVRRESSTNAKDVSYTTGEGTLSENEYQDILETKGLYSLFSSKKELGFSAVVDSSIGGFLYGRDFYLGDIVQAVNEFGIGGQMRVTEFVISEDNSGILAYPKFEMIEGG